jgi:signal transduction histidine kinase
MSETIKARLFEPFFSTKGDLGNGLGLYISREIVERHKGKIEIKSEEASGTTVSVWLPHNPAVSLMRTTPEENHELGGGSTR